MSYIARLPGRCADLWDWQLQAACRGMASSLFFHPPGERGVPREEREASAKAICRSCPVVQECLAHSLAVQESYGVWGGLSEGERQTVLAQPERRGRPPREPSPPEAAGN